MAYHARRALWSMVPLTLVLACASGADDSMTSNSGFGSNPNPSDPLATSTGDAPPTSTASTGILATEGSTGRDTTGRDTDDMRDTTTGGTDPVVTTSVGESSTGVGEDSTGVGDESSTGPVVLCGNAMIDENEECDGANLDAMTCTSLGFSGGVLTCTPQCIFDKSKCTSPSCGDGTVDAGEECDCGQQGANCTAQQLGNAACTTLASPGGGNYSAGTLACNSPGSCSFNKAACVYCGDGIKNAAEACDGGDLGGQSCQTQGFNGGGSLSCSACAFNTGGCQNIVCGNAQCQAGEDSCNCPADCPDDPNSCSPCQCGLSGGTCYCDAACTEFGDCCFNGPC